MSVSAGPNIVEDGLLLYLDAANENSYPGTGTTWTDLSGNGNNGTLTNGPTYSSNNGGAIAFDAVNDYVNLGDKFSINQATIDFWVKLNVTISSSTPFNYRPFGKSDGFEGRWNYSISLGPVGVFTFDLGTATGPLLSNQSTWLSGIWYNIVLSWNTSINTSNIYVQSILDNTSTATSITGQVGNFSLGASRGGTLGFMNGSISTFKIYNKYLSASEIKQNFNATRSRYGV